MDYLKIYNTLDSTNKEAQRLLASGPVLNGLTLLARHQTAGRGQYGRHWVSAADHHLAMSLIYKPRHFDASALPTIGMKVSLGIIYGLQKINPDLQPLIKWPNDIYAEGKKLCGLLIENALSGSTVQHSIIGLGMNINEAEFPSEIPNATSLHLISGLHYDVEKTARILRQAIMDILEAPDPSWKSDYDQVIYGRDELHLFQSTHGPLQAKVKGISLEGHILLEDPEGEIKAYASHELKWEIR